MRRFLLFIMLSGTVAVRAQTGPGGVGLTNGTSSLKLWYRVDNGVSTTGTTVNSWANAAGISALNIAETGGNRPTLVASAVNGYSEISFNGANRLVTAIGAITTTNFVTSQVSSFVVCRADNTTQTSCVYTTDPLENAPATRFSNHVPWSGTVYYDIGTCCDDRIQVGGLSGLTGYSVWSYDAINTATGKQLYRNGTQVQSVGVAASTYSNHATQRFNIGGNTTNGEAAGFAGDITEVIIYTTKVNTAQRIIIENYLAAKYGLTLSSNDLYTHDNAGSGNYDHDVAGIGRVNATNIQNDSRGTGIIRILNPGSLDDGDYYFWGHDNGALVAQTTDIPAGVQGRFTRVWRGQEIGAISDFDIDFDLTGQGAVTVGQLRLLIDTDNDGNFADETVAGGGIISGASAQGSNVYRFANITGLVTGGGNTRRFTLGTTNITQTPLPITLISFEAKVDDNKQVRLHWRTAQEINNEYFTVERSVNGTAWEIIETTKGGGTTNEPMHYSLVDKRPLWGVSYYRLKQTDFNGTYTYSDVRIVSITKTFQDITVYPIPAKDEIFVELPPSENVVVSLYDLLGHHYAVDQFLEDRGIKMNTASLPSGVYLLYITNRTESSYKKIVIE